MYAWNTVLVAIAVVAAGAHGRTTNGEIDSPNLTKYNGTYGAFEYCPNGTYVGGFRMRQEPYNCDDCTALNTLELSCMKIDSSEVFAKITSTKGAGGMWLSHHLCNNGFITGFTLSASVPDTRHSDYLGAITMNAVCSNGATLHGESGWDLDDKQTWGALRTCPKGTAACGLSTQVMPYNKDQDNTALNNIKMKCCAVAVPDIGCKPNDAWEDVMQCDNTDGDVELKCAYKKTVGSSRTYTRSESGSWTLKDREHVGITVGADFLWFKSEMSVKYGHSSTTGKDWSKSTSQEFSKETTIKIEAPAIKPGQNFLIQQVVGSCGPFSSHATNFRFRPHNSTNPADIIDLTDYSVAV